MFILDHVMEPLWISFFEWLLNKSKMILKGFVIGTINLLGVYLVIVWAKDEVVWPLESPYTDTRFLCV